MIVLTIIALLWGIVSYYRLHKISKKNNTFFNPMEGTLMDFMGYLAGIITLFWVIIIICITFLP